MWVKRGSGKNVYSLADEYRGLSNKMPEKRGKKY